MLSYYFKIIFRNMVQSKTSSVISISGLAIGIASFILIAGYIFNELSYDRFHEGYENLYRINTYSKGAGMATDVATSHSPLAQALLTTYPEVVKATRLLQPGSLRIGLQRENRHYSEDKILFADSNFFDVFNFKLLKGDPRTALLHPRSLVLSKTYAQKYFGDEDPIGKAIAIEDDTSVYLVTGVVADVPANSHIQFEMIGSMSGNAEWNGTHWISGAYVHTYVRLRPGTNVKAFEAKLREVVYKYLAPEIEYYSGLTMAQWENAGSYTGYYLIPLKDIHLYSTSTDELEAGGNISYIYIYAVIALIILSTAIFNYVNLATARAASRAKEVGVRKVMGSSKKKLIYQFLMESVAVSIVATALAMMLVMASRSAFETLAGKRIDVSMIAGYVWMPALLGLAIVIGILGGIFPSFVLAGFQPAKVLKGVFTRGRSFGWLRNLLVGMQFTAAIVIIAGTIVVYRQLNFMLNKNLGFNKEQVLVIRRPDELKGHFGAFRDALLASPAIRSVAYSNTIPGKPYPRRSYRVSGSPQVFVFKFNQVSYDYLTTMGLRMAAGRFFSKEHGLDTKAVVINEALAKKFGFADPVGKQVGSAWHKRGELWTIIGVVKDFNIESLHKSIEPVAMELIPENAGMDGYITVKMKGEGNIRATMQDVERAWAMQTNGKLFESFFFDEEYQKIYQSEFTTGRVLIVFTALSIFIACLGLTGLLTFTVAVRKKEIGIRKVLGARVGSLVRLLSADVVKLIGISALIAWPLAYLGTRYWLQNFVDRIPFDAWVYLDAPLLIVVFCGLAIGLQVVKAAIANPVKSLRME